MSTSTKPLPIKARPLTRQECLAYAEYHEARAATMVSDYARVERSHAQNWRGLARVRDNVPVDPAHLNLIRTTGRCG